MLSREIDTSPTRKRGELLLNFTSLARRASVTTLPYFEHWGKSLRSSISPFSHAVITLRTAVFRRRRYLAQNHDARGSGSTGEFWSGDRAGSADGGLAAIAV